MKATFEQFLPQTYGFEVEGPGGDVFEFDMRAPTTDERARIVFEDPEPKLEPSDFYTKNKETQGVFPIYDYEDAGYKKARAAWLVRQQKRLIIAYLVEPAVPGESLDEQMVALDGLASWALDALWRAVEMLIVVGRDAVRRRTFQRGPGANSGALRAEGLEPEPVLPPAELGAPGVAELGAPAPTGDDGLD